MRQNAEAPADARVGPSAQADQVTVCCSARLHLGFLDLNGGLGRRFGSLGLALDAPCTRLTLRRAQGLRVTGAEPERATRLLTEMLRHSGLDETGHALAIAEAIPAHAGLGSGTQLALAIAAALRRLHGLPPDPAADAMLLGRGARSGVGLHLFRHGGVVVDGGRGAREQPPPLLSRLPVPEDWRVVLVLDPARQGLAGGAEIDAFAGLTPLPEAAAAEICRLVLMQALPGVAEDDIGAFGAAVTRMQEIVGDHFAPAQGGRFTSPPVAAALAGLRAAGAVGIGQSSWGPTGFAFIRGEAAARRAADAAAAQAAGLDFMVCRGLNHGASVAAG